MTTYTDVFGGANIYPSEISYSAIALTSDVTLSWPEETSTNEFLATRIIDLAANSVGFSVFLPPADKTGNGNTILFNNVGAQIITIRDADGVQILTIGNGELWQIYLTDNSSPGGVWETLRYGATISQANASALAGTGIVAVGTLLSQSVPVVSFNTNYTSGAADRARMFNWTGGGGTITLPNPMDMSIGNNWFIYLRNSGTGAVAADAPGLVMIDGNSSLSFQPGESAIIVSDGQNFYTIGFGQSATFAFDYTVINVPGTGTYTLSGSELNRVAYRFTGLLTGNRSIVVPATVQQYWVDNATSGAFTLTITPSGGGIPFNVGQGQRVILYCDGTNVLNASTQGISVPLTIAEGGTNAVTASAARINLGATSLGDALFTAANTAAAYATLGTAPAGVVNGGSF